MGSQTSKSDSYSEIGGTCDEESGCLLPAQQHYRNPHQRRQLRKRREVLAEPPDPRIDPTADKYDYLIVFKKVPQSRRVNIDSATGAFNVPKQKSGDVAANAETKKRVSWSGGSSSSDDMVASEVWFSACSGEADEREAGVKSLKETWKSATRQETVRPDTSISFSQFLNISRDHIITTLMKQSGLQLKLTSRKKLVGKTKVEHCCSSGSCGLSCGGYCCSGFDVEGTDECDIEDVIYCRIRAPLALLEKKAAAISYHLQFKGEVDPGYEFWTKADRAGNLIEVEEEASLIPTKDLASEQLEGMFDQRLVSPRDMHVFENEPTPIHWSRRIHTLERIADHVHITNPFPAFSAFELHPSERHLYEEYPSVRGKTLFLPKDRLYLTRLLLEDVFDFQALKREGLVETFIPLHDASRGERITKDSFTATWLFPWRGDWRWVGAPTVSHPASSEGIYCPWYLWLWAQPLNDIREYFGESVALYFAWLGHYSLALVFPALMGILLEVYIYSSGQHSATWHSLAMTWHVVCFSALIILWVAWYEKSWEGEERVCAVKWGTRGFEDEEGNRPQFHGDVPERLYMNILFGCPSKPDSSRRLSEVTYRPETYYPPEKRAVKMVLTTMCLSLTILALCGLYGALGFLEFVLVKKLQLSYGALLTVVLAAALTKTFSKFFTPWCVAATEWENHQTESQYLDAKIKKTFGFEMINYYGFLFFTAFARHYTFGCTNDDCMQDVKIVLIGVFIVRFCSFFVETFGSSFNSRRNLADIDREANDAALFEDATQEATVVVEMHFDKAAKSFLMRCRRDNPLHPKGPNENLDSSGEDSMQAHGFEMACPPENLDAYGNELRRHGPTNPLTVELSLHQRGPTVAKISRITSTILRVLPQTSLAMGDAVFTKSALLVACERARDRSQAAKLSDVELFEYEVSLEQNDSTFDEYASILLQMGYVFLFSICWGWTPVLALVESLLQIRGDAYALVRTKQRPELSPAEDIGAWADVIKCLGGLAVFTNTAIICFSTHALDDFSTQSKFLIFFLMEHSFFILSQVFSKWLSSNPIVVIGERRQPLSTIVARQNFVVDKHKMMRIVDTVDMGDAAKGSTLDADVLSLANMSSAVSDRVKNQIQWLKKKLRLTNSKIEELKGNLRVANEGEVWNEATGVAEAKTLSGLALGMVQLKVLSLEGLSFRDHPINPSNTHLVVSVRDRSKYPTSAPYSGKPGPDAQVSNSGMLEVKNGKRYTVFNQEFQLAPVKTNKAEVVVDVVDSRTKRKRGTAVLPLNQFLDQQVSKKIVVVEPSAEMGVAAPALTGSAGGSDEKPRHALHLQLRFQYSKTKPIKEELYQVFEEKRAIETDAAALALGLECTAEPMWDWEGI